MKPTADIDIEVAHPRDGHVRLTSRRLFADPRAEICHRFIGQVFDVEEVRAIEIVASRAVAHIEYTNGIQPCRQVIEKIARRLRHGPNGNGRPYVNSLGDLPIASADDGATWRVERHGSLLSTWEIKHELPGRIRVRNRLIRGKTDLCRAVERALGRTLGVESCTTNPRTATALVLYAPDKVGRHQLIQVLDRALIDAGGDDVPKSPGIVPWAAPEERLAPLHGPSSADVSFTGKEQPWSSWEFVVMALSLGTAAAGILLPPLGVLSVPGTLYVTRALYIDSFWRLVKEHRIAVDSMTAGIHVVSVLTGYYFIFCLNSFLFMCARNLLDKVKQDSRADYTDVFRQQAHTVWIRVDGVDVETPLETVKVDDLVSLAPGQTIPVDGRVIEGTGTVDQHLLTGEAAPADKGVGDPVFAMTVMLSGRIYVHVEKTGAATAAAHIATVLNRTVDFKTGRQLRAERVSDRLVWPALTSGLLAWPFLGPSAAGGLIDAHPKYKTTLSSSLGLLNYFKLAAREGLLIKDGRTLELVNAVDTVVFDKTGTLTVAQPHVARLHTRRPHAGREILRLAAAAEQHQSHPIARAIRDAAARRGLPVPAIEHADYRRGYGLTVTVDQRLVRVGSMRFLQAEAVAIPPALTEIEAECHRNGHSLVLVAIGDEVAGALELHPSIRPEAPRVIEGLRQRGVTSTYVISGDHEAPTRRLAAALGIDHYFAETLPERKAELIDQLRDAGKVICYVGDGINDAIAMKKAHVSVSLRGASTLAVDTAEVILLDESLNQLGRLFDIAAECRRSMTVTLAAVFGPSLACVAGVLVFNLGFAQARLINVAGLAAGVSAAMLPRLTHRPAPTPADGPEASVPTSSDVPLEECAVA